MDDTCLVSTTIFLSANANCRRSNRATIHWIQTHSTKDLGPWVNLILFCILYLLADTKRGYFWRVNIRKPPDVTTESVSCNSSTLAFWKDALRSESRSCPGAPDPWENCPKFAWTQMFCRGMRMGSQNLRNASATEPNHDMAGFDSSLP